MEPKKDAIWESLEDTQPMPISTEVYRDDCGWWEEFGDTMPATSRGPIIASEGYPRLRP